VLRGMGAFVIAYIDDILIFSASLTDHTQHLQAVFDALLANQLWLSPG
jgi:hypothetical protein